MVVTAANPSRSPRRLRKRKRRCCRAEPDDMDINEEYPDIRFFRTFREVWSDDLTWEEIRANKFRPWGPRESASQDPPQSTPVPMSPVPSSVSSSDESVVATVVVSAATEEVSQPLFSQSPPESASPPEQPQPQPPSESPPELPPELPPEPVVSPDVSPSVLPSDLSPPPEPMVSLMVSPPVVSSEQSPPPNASRWRAYALGAQGYIDFGLLTHDIYLDRGSFEFNRLVMYHHRGCQRPAKTPSPFDALRGETVVIQGMHKIQPLSFPCSVSE